MRQVLLVGLGRMGMNHLRNLIRLLPRESIWAYDPNSEAQQRALHEGINVIKHDKQIEPLVPRISHAIIATPTTTHIEWIKRLASAVDNILVEKPVVNASSEASEILKMVNRPNVQIFGGFVERFNPSFSELRRQLEALDSVFAATFTRTSKTSSRILDVDVLSDLLVHDLDLANLLFGEIKKISATGTALHGEIDHADVMITHVSGVKSRLTASRVVHRKIRLIEVNGANGRLECDLLKKDLLLLRDLQESEIPGKPYKLLSQSEVIEVKATEPLFVELSHFLNGKGSSEGAPTFHTLTDALELAHQVEKIRMEIKSDL